MVNSGQAIHRPWGSAKVADLKFSCRIVLCLLFEALKDCSDFRSAQHSKIQSSSGKCAHSCGT